MPSRMDRINEIILQELNKLLIDLSEQWGIVVVTLVNTTPDLKEADVYFRPLEETHLASPGTLLKLLNHRAREYHSALRKTLSIKFTPNLRFKLDEGQDTALRVEELFNKIERGNQK